jgi:hypothetical protein
MRKRKPNSRPCATKFCRRKAAPDRTVCCTCKNRIYRAKNPVRYAYNTLHDNCKRRKIPFDLSFADFQKFCYKTDYIRGKGKTAESYSIDRRNEDPAKGYHGYRLDNIRIMTLADNTRKKNARILNAHYDERERKLFATVTRAGNYRLTK